jgi:RHS repeat-associated protein
MASTTAVRTVWFEYDLAGNLTSTGDSDVQPGPIYDTTYDALSRTDVVTAHYIPGGDRTLDSDYDRYGNRKRLTLTDQGQVLVHDYHFNKQNQLDQAVFPGAGGVGTSPIGFEYFGNDDLKRITRASGVTTDYTYWPSGPVRDLIVKDSGGTPLDQLSYAYDPTSNPTSLAEYDGSTSLGSHGYDYDAVGRLTSATHPAGLGLPTSEEFAYDRAGNREDPSDPSLWTYDANNRITASPGFSYVFDDDGSLATRTDASTGAQEQFSYDFVNRLRGYAKPGTTASYSYDAAGRRIEKTVNGATTWFLWDGDVLLREYGAAGSSSTRYAYAGGDAPLELDQAAALYDVHSDRLETPRLLTKTADQAKAWRQRLQAYGSAVVADDLDGDGLAARLNARFPGQYGDQETDSHYNRARYYDPASGRFFSKDPLLLRGSRNAYLYGDADPERYVDPSGLIAIGFPAVGLGGSAVEGTGPTAEATCIPVYDLHGNRGLLCCGGAGPGYGLSGQVELQIGAAVCPLCDTICDMGGLFTQIGGTVAAGEGVNVSVAVSVNARNTTVIVMGGGSAGGGAAGSATVGTCTVIPDSRCGGCHK